jgi:hypothetical protein
MFDWIRGRKKQDSLRYYPSVVLEDLNKCFTDQDKPSDEL